MATRKREELSNLIKNLVDKYKLPITTLPEIAFPTIDGQLVESSDFTDEHADFEEDDEEMQDNVSLIVTSNTFAQITMPQLLQGADGNAGELNNEPTVEKKRLIYKPNPDSESVRKKRRNV